MPDAAPAKGSPSRTLEPEVRRDEILRAAAKVFGEKGFYNARISDVAAEAGVAQGTIYRFFASKEDLAASLLTNGLASLSDVIDRAVRDAEAEGDPGRALELFVDRAARVYDRHPAELLALHSWSVDPAGREHVKGSDEELVAAIRKLVVAAGDRVWHPPGVDVARLLLLLLYGFSSQLGHYRVSKVGGDTVAQLIKKVVFA